MAEEEINYASVVFKTKTRSPPKAKNEEETVNNEVKVQNQTTEQTADINAKNEEETVNNEVKVQNQTTKQTADINASTGFLPDKKATNSRRHYQQLACCSGILCVILLLGIIAVYVYLSTYNNDNELQQLKHNQTTLLESNHNLTDLNNKFSSENENLRRDYNNLTVNIGNLTQTYTVLESKITNLTVENQNLTAEYKQLNTRKQELETQHQELETLRNNLAEQIQNTEKSVTQAQWSINAYCPKENKVRQCKACQKGWLHNQSSCYAIDDTKSLDQRTWEGARDNCRGKISELVKIVNEDEKKFINDNSKGTSGYWIGLRVEDGRWKWIDGSDLTENSWMQQTATNGHCAISVRNEGWKSVKCDDRNRWICKKKALSV